MKFRDHWSDEMREAWESAPETHRFSYKTNRVVVGMILGQLGILWSLFVYTVFSLDAWVAQLTYFSVLYGAFTAVLLTQVLKWRSFVLLSGVVFGNSRLYWVQGHTEHSALRRTLDPERMGLTQADQWNRFEAALQIDLNGGGDAPLYLYRPYAYLGNLEGMMERLLEKMNQTKNGVQKGRKR